MVLFGGSKGRRHFLHIALAIQAFVLMAGCGGSGGGSAGIILPPPGTPSSDGRAGNATASFHVDVNTGEVTVTPVTGRPARKSGRAIFTGSAIQFTSSVLLDQPGDVGRKVLNVSLTNRSGEPIGQLPNGGVSGVRVLFSGFANVGAFSDPRPRIKVTTFAGSGAAGSVNGPPSAASFNLPDGVAVDGTGTVYVADSLGNRIRKIANGLVSNLAGSGAAGSNNAAGDAATFYKPYGIALNPLDGAIIVTELLGNRIRRITPDGRVSLVAGTGASGSANGLGNVATFNGPTGVAIDSAGIIYIGDTLGNKIRKIVLTGDPTLAVSYTVSTLCGTGAPGWVDGIGSVAQFNIPYGIALGPDSALYVADSNNQRIRRVTLTGEVTTVAGSGGFGSADGSGEAATFNGPIGVTWSGSALIVSELSQLIRQIRLKQDGAAPGKSDSWYVQRLAGTPATHGSTDGDGTAALFYSPRLIGTGIAGAVYVPDGLNNKIRKIVPTNGFFPVGVATGAVPTEEVQLANADGVIPSPANRPFLTYSGAMPAGASSPAQPWVFTIPNGVTAFEFTVTVEANTAFLASPETVSNPGPGGAGSPNVNVRTVAGIPGRFGFVDGIGSAALFSSFIAGMSVDGAGNVFLADFHNNSIRRISVDGTVSTIAGVIGVGGGSPIDGAGNIARFNGPIGIAVTQDGRTVYVGDANNNRIRRISISPGADPTVAANWFVSTIAGTGIQGTMDGAGNAATFALPEGVAIDPGGIIYFSEIAGQRIRRLQFSGGDPNVAANWQVHVLAGDNSTTFPAGGTTDALGTAARFSSPTQIACDRAGNIWVADSFNNRIRRVTPLGLVSTPAGTTSGYADGSGGTEKFAGTQGIALDSAGFAYVADNGNDVIRRVSPGGVVSTVAGIVGTPGTANGAGNVATFTTPFGMAVDSSGNVYVGGTTGEVRIIQRVISSGSQ